MKIKVSKTRNKKAKFDFSHDVHTTADIGFVQPICRLELIPGSTLHINDIASRLRLMPLVAPTYGQYHLKHYAHFVPLRDLWMPFENLMTGTAYNGVSGTFVPDTVPQVRISDLTRVVCMHSEYAIFTVPDYELSDDEVISGTWSNALGGSFDHFTIAVPSQKNMQIDACDFIYRYGRDSVIGFKLNRKGKNLRKILLGLGYQLNFDCQDYVSFLPILAYYKAYWDTFGIKQTENWEYTPAYSLINLLSQVDNPNIHSRQDLTSSLRAFFKSLCEDCYYTCNPDYFTMQLDTLSKSMTTASLWATPGGESDNLLEVFQQEDYLPSVQISDADFVSSSALRILDKFTRWVNRNTVIGQRVGALMSAMGLGSADDNKKNYFIGSTSQAVDIYPVMSQADTYDSGSGDGMTVGDYAGQGVGDGHSGNMKFDVDCYGYLIILSTVVPRMNGHQYFQGIQGDLYHKGRMEFYQPDFDSMAFIPSRKTQYMAAEEYGNTGEAAVSHAGSFGYQPSFAEYKYKTDVINGDMSLRSTRTELAPYHLDRIISPVDIANGGDGYTVPFNPAVSPELRYIGKHEYFGNFNRPFQQSYDGLTSNQQPLEDNFIVTNFLDIAVIAPMKPLSESFDTFPDGDGSAMSVEKA